MLSNGRLNGLTVETAITEYGCNKYGVEMHWVRQLEGRIFLNDLRASREAALLWYMTALHDPAARGKLLSTARIQCH